MSADDNPIIHHKKEPMKLHQHFAAGKPPPAHTLHLGDCVEIMRGLPTRSIDFILTDPPYLARYKDRTGRTVENDTHDAWLKPSFAEMFRLLKRDAFGVSFYGWPKAERFLDAWKAAGFRVGGHIVFRKRYASNAAFVQYRHEQAFLLITGRPAYPAAPPPDVIDMPYTGNKLHPTQKPLAALKPLIAAFSQPGDTVLDPFAGSGSTLIAAHLLNRVGLGIELDPAHHCTATHRLHAAEQKAACASVSTSAQPPRPRT